MNKITTIGLDLLEFQRRKTTLNSGTKFGNVKKLHDDATSATHCFYRYQPWRAKRRLVVPSSREAALLTRRAHSARGEAK